MPDPIRGVNPTGPLGVDATGSTGGQATSRTAQDEPAAAATPVDSADVTQAEALLTAIGSMADAIPVADQTKVAQIQQAIAAGTYQVNPQALAQKMLDIERLLSATTPTPGQ